MNDRVPGSCWHTPIWYGKWRIFVGDDHAFEFVHDDYDGAVDSSDWRFGLGSTIESCKKQIDEWEKENS